MGGKEGKQIKHQEKGKKRQHRELKIRKEDGDIRERKELKEIQHQVDGKKIQHRQLKVRKEDEDDPMFSDRIIEASRMTTDKSIRDD